MRCPVICAVARHINDRDFAIDLAGVPRNVLTELSPT
jgi:hypothetical protein